MVVYFKYIYIYILGGYCKYEDLVSINPPSFLSPDIGPTDVIPSSQYLSYTCNEDGTMLPNAIDPDSNFALEVNCVEGSFEGMYLC